MHRGLKGFSGELKQEGGQLLAEISASEDLGLDSGREVSAQFERQMEQFF